jgi:hypothetical protein
MLPQQQLQLQKPSTIISPFSLPPLFIIVKEISQNSTRDLLVSFRLHIRAVLLNLTISLQMILSYEQAILLMISPPKQAIKLIISTLLSTVQ